MGLDCMTDVSGFSTRTNLGNSKLQAFPGFFHQLPGRIRDLSDDKHPARISKVTIDDTGHINIDDVPVHKNLFIGNAVTDDFVDRGADAFGKGSSSWTFASAIIEGSRNCSLGESFLVNPFIDLVGADPRLDSILYHIQQIPSETTAFTDSFQLFLGFDQDPAWVLRNRCLWPGRRLFPAQMAFLELLPTSTPAGIIPGKLFGRLRPFFHRNAPWIHNRC